MNSIEKQTKKKKKHFYQKLIVVLKLVIARKEMPEKLIYETVNT